MKGILLLTLAFLTIGCSNETTQSIEIRHFFRSDQLKETIKARVVTKVTRDSVAYTYLTDSTILFRFKKDNNDDSFLTYINFNIPLVDKKVFITNGHETEIKKYDYDEENMYDEEESIYFIDSYGVIAIKSNAWSNFIQFDKEGQFEKLIFEFLQRDTSGFYGYRPPPKIDIDID